MKITIMILLFFSLVLSDNPVYDIEYHYDNINIKSITYYNIRNNKIELARIELYWINGQKYSESYHVGGLKYKEMLWYENGQKGMECKEVDARGVNCKYWRRDGNTVKEEELSNLEENELFLEYRNRYF